MLVVGVFPSSKHIERSRMAVPQTGIKAKVQMIRLLVQSWAFLCCCCNPLNCLTLNLYCSGCKDEQTSGDVGDVGAFNLPKEVGPGGAGGACTNSMMQTFYKSK